MDFRFVQRAFDIIDSIGYWIMTTIGRLFVKRGACSVVAASVASVSSQGAVGPMPVRPGGLRQAWVAWIGKLSIPVHPGGLVVCQFGLAVVSVVWFYQWFVSADYCVSVFESVASVQAQTWHFGRPNVMGLSPTLSTVRGVAVLGMISSALLLFRRGFRFNCGVAWLMAQSLCATFSGAAEGEDYLETLLLTLFLCMGSVATLRVSPMRVETASVESVFPLIFRTQVFLAYALTTWCKLCSAEWLSGDVIGRLLHISRWVWFPPFEKLAFLGGLLTFAIIVVEGLCAVMVFYKNRWWSILPSLIVHTSIMLTLGLWTFGPLMLCLAVSSYSYEGIQELRVVLSRMKNLIVAFIRGRHGRRNAARSGASVVLPILIAACLFPAVSLPGLCQSGGTDTVMPDGRVVHFPDPATEHSPDPAVGKEWNDAWARGDEAKVRDMATRAGASESEVDGDLQTMHRMKENSAPLGSSADEPCPGCGQHTQVYIPGRVSAGSPGSVYRFGRGDVDWHQAFVVRTGQDVEAERALGRRVIRMSWFCGLAGLAVMVLGVCCVVLKLRVMRLEA